MLKQGVPAVCDVEEVSQRKAGGEEKGKFICRKGKGQGKMGSTETLSSLYREECLTIITASWPDWD